MEREFASFDYVKTEFDKVNDEIQKLKMNIDEHEKTISILEFNESLLKNITETLQDVILVEQITKILFEYKNNHNIDGIRVNLQELYTKKNELVRNVKSLFSSTTDSPPCSVCIDLSVDTFLKSCGHTFCTRCVARNKNQKCPQCRTPYSYDDIKSLIFS